MMEMGAERCLVCGFTFNPAHRRKLTMHGKSVTYCADNAECGEARAHEYLNKVAASEQIGDRERTALQDAGEVQIGPATVAGLMQMLDDLGIDPFAAELPTGALVRVVAV